MANETKRIPISKSFERLTEAAAQLGCCEMTIRRYIKSGKLKGYRFTEAGGPHFVRIADVRKLVEQRTAKN